MGNSLSQSSRSLNRESNNSNSNFKENRRAKPKFASPENRVLPVVTSGPQRLRSTDNGNILQSGGTISRRKAHHLAESSNESEFTRYIQKKYQVYDSTPQNTSFQTLFGHKKSHSDPDIVRKMMEENETEEDDDGRYETESNPNQRSIIALSPSKAKIKSRKKKKAPEPPQPNTLPRAVVRRNSSKRENQEMGDFNSNYDINGVPRRPLPPIPLEEMPPPPPPPSPDYNVTSNDREISKAAKKNFQKNRRIVDKWKFIKPNSEYFAERRQRSKSLDRADDLKLKELSSKCEKFDRNYSFRSVVPREEFKSHRNEAEENIPTKLALNEAIIDAARKREERLANSRMRRNLSFISSMDQAYEANDTGQSVNCSSAPSKEKDSYSSGNLHSNMQGYRNSHKENDIYVKNNINAHHIEPRATGPQNHFQRESGLNARALPKPQDSINRERSFAEQRISRSSENLDEFTKGQQNSYGDYIPYEKDFNTPYLNRQCYSSNPPKNNTGISHTDHINSCANRDQYQRITNMVQHQNEHKDSYEQREHSKYKLSHSNERVENYHLKDTNSFGGTRQSNTSCNHVENQEGSRLSRNFSRVGAIHKRSYEKKKKHTPSYRTQNDENVIRSPNNQISRADLGILPSFPADKQIKRNARSQEPIIPFLPNGTISSSSISEEEMEINLQLRPTLPRKPIDIPRFSPTDVWKSINLDFFKSHQQRSDVSSEDGEGIMEEKIHRINRPVAPRRLIHDRSGDSGISPDAGSPMFLNENFDSPVIANDALWSPTVALNEDANATWVPQQDLEDSECGSDTSRENKFNVASKILQPKLAMPNLMFPSRSLPRTDQKGGMDEKEVPSKEKMGRDRRRRRCSKSNEIQHFNSLRNLKRVLGLKPKALPVDANDIDSNWSLSRSLPSFENVENLVDTKIANEVPQENIPDQTRNRSNSESRTREQEGGRNMNLEWRKSFPGQCTEGHIMYLPEYYSTNIRGHMNLRKKNEDHAPESNTNNLDISKNETGEGKVSSESTKTKTKSKKKFSYQSTMRQLEKKKIEAQLAKEVKEKEKQRESEKELINFVEDEFRKHRVKDKLDVRQRLRIHSLEISKECSTDGLNLEKDTKEDSIIMKEHLKCPSLAHNLKENEIQSSSFTQELSRDISQTKNFVENSRNPKDFSTTSETIQSATQIYDQRIENYSEGTDSSLHFKHAQKRIVPEISVSHDNTRKEEHEKSFRNNNPNTYITQNAACDRRTLFNDKESTMNKNGVINKEARMNVRNCQENAYLVECPNGIDKILSNGQRNTRTEHHYNVRENYSPINNTQKVNNLDNGIVYKNNIQNSNILSNSRKITTLQSTQDLKTDQRFSKVESNSSPRDYTSTFEENDAMKNKTRENDSSYAIQQPTGMKKWLRRQNRDHHCSDNLLRPEPEGGRSSSDDCKHTEGKTEGLNGRSQHFNAKFQGNTRCIHGNSFCCVACKDVENQFNGFRKNGAESDDTSRIRSERSRDNGSEVHPKMQITNENGVLENNSHIPVGAPFIGESVEEYELHTRLCRTSSGRTFESHSYYALERRKDDPEYQTARKRNPVDDPQNNFFSSLNFEKELRENVRKKSRDFDKRARKYPSCDYDTDDSGSDRKEDRYQRHNIRNQKKRPLSDHRETSFSRNHPHRNGARIKPQTNGHFQNGRTCSISKSNQAVVA